MFLNHVEYFLKTELKTLRGRVVNLWTGHIRAKGYTWRERPQSRLNRAQGMCAETRGLAQEHKGFCETIWGQTEENLGKSHGPY